MFSLYKKYKLWKTARQLGELYFFFDKLGLDAKADQMFEAKADQMFEAKADQMFEAMVTIDKLIE